MFGNGLQAQWPVCGPPDNDVDGALGEMELLDGRGDGFSVNAAAIGVVVGEVPHGKVNGRCPGFGVVCGGFSNNLEARQVDAWGERLGVLWVSCLKKGKVLLKGLIL